MSQNSLPSYLADAKPNAMSNRAPWYKNTAPAYAGIILWFAFWNNIITSSTLTEGLLVPVAAIVTAALLCHFLFYLIPGLLGMKSGFSLTVVGSSVFGINGGIVMPGLFMGLLQFGWVAVNCYFAADLLKDTIPVPAEAIMVVWGALATFIGLKGIKYVAGIATWLPIIPLAVLIIMLVATISGVANFDPKFVASSVKMTTAGVAQVQPADSFAIFAGIVAAMVGFFATAGAAGVDFGTGSRNSKDVQLGGLVGVSLAMIFTCVVAALILAGAYGNTELALQLKGNLKPTDLMALILGAKTGKILMFLLALAAFPSACFSSLIAANSFKTALPRINSTISVSLGGAVAIILAVTGIAGNAGSVFGFIGISFGPICGAMFIDYFLSGCKWSGPRAGFNAAGWLSWIIGFAVGALPTLGINIPMAPICAFGVGAIVYLLAMMSGLKSKVVVFNK